MSTPIRIAVTGAAGNVGYSLLFRIAAGAMFGPEQPVELSLLGSPHGQAKLDPIPMELFDCAFPILVRVEATTDPIQAFAGADWVILLGSTPYRTGLQRSDLLLANGPIFREHGHAINESAPARGSWSWPTRATPMLSSPGRWRRTSHSNTGSP